MVSGRLLVEARGLTKTYPARNGTPPFCAVDGIDFEFGRGEAFGFLGPNGAGKSSTMRMLGAISPATAGRLRVLGMDPAQDGPKIRARIGVVPQDDCLDRELTVRENIYVYGRYFGLGKSVIRARLGGLLAFAQLEDRADAQVETLSGGMRRRLTIARSLINQPEILLLDEPTTGLDPQARHVLWDRLYRLKADGVTLIITTHYMDEAEQLCDRLAVMDAGRIVAEGSPRALIEAHITREVLELRFTPDTQSEAAERLRAAALGERIEELPDRVVVYADDGEAALVEVHHQLSLTPITALVRRATLEDVFLKLTGRSLID
jgi:lipooligosaccharide transport system ATP-binding protein